MLEPEKLPARPERLREEVFTERYERLLAWALRLTNQHRATAEDLVQDAFIQFTRGRTSLDAIENVDGYLRRMLRNMNLSRISRYPEQVQERTVSIAEHDLLQLDSRSLELQHQIQVQEELYRICKYACTRKETSRAGSVLILRFFFEYSPTEIAQVLCCSRHCVDQWQRFARREVKLYLEDPRRLKFVTAKPQFELPQIKLCRAQTGLAEELRRIIFHARTGECLGGPELEEIYRMAHEETLTSVKLGHIVTCRTCLDKVNRILGLPLLSQRYQTEAPRSPTPPPPPDNTGGGSDSGTTDLATKFHRRLREVVEHEPQELQLEVNSICVGSLQVSGDSSELVLNISQEDRIEFVEILSEEQMRLLFFNVTEEHGSGAEQWAQIELSHNRILEACLSSKGSSRSLRISYWRPGFSNAANLASATRLLTAEQVLPNRRFEFIHESLAYMKSLFTAKQWWMKPQVISVFIGIIAIGAALLLRPGLTAKNVLKEASLSETAELTGNGVIHRRVNLEERKGTGELISLCRIETWQDTGRERSTRHVYDERNQLIAGASQQSDGTRIIYHHGSQPQRDVSPADYESFFDVDPWRLDLTARQFGSIIGSSIDAQIEEANSEYVIRWNAHGVRRMIGESRLLSATLILTKPDLRAVEQIIEVERGREKHEYRFSEEHFERLREDDVPPAVFAQDFFPSSKNSASNEQQPITKVVKNNSVVRPLHFSSEASTELEIDVLYLLNTAKGERSEQITLSRAANGFLHVEGVVDTEERKQEILQALSPVGTNPLVKIELETAPNAKSARQPGSQGRTVQLSVEPTSDTIPVYSDLREYLSQRDKSGDIDDAIRDFSSRVVNRAYRALFHAIELRRLMNRFSKMDLRMIAPEARRKWLEMIREHATAFEAETSELRRQIQPIFFSSRAPKASSDDDELVNDAQLSRAIDRLHASALFSNTAIRDAFTISSKNSSASVKSDDFWQALVTAENLAARIKQRANSSSSSRRPPD